MEWKQSMDQPGGGSLRYLSMRFSMCLTGAAVQRFISKRDSVSPLLDATSRNPSNL